MGVFGLLLVSYFGRIGYKVFRELLGFDAKILT